MNLRSILFIATQDVRFQVFQGATIVWVFIMPPVFFYFIGTVTGGSPGAMSGGVATPIAIFAEQPGFLKSQLDLRLRENDFVPTWTEARRVGGEAAPARTLEFDANLTDAIVAGDSVDAVFDTRTSALSRDYEAIRLQRSLYTVLADVVVADARSSEPLIADDLAAINAQPRIWQLESSPAGKRQEIPTGFEQAIPGMLVMFTLLVLLTSGSAMLAVERKQGLLRRLASTPISRGELIAGKWGGRMILAAVQIAVALAFGTWMFSMAWGPDFGMVLVVLFAWAAFCASGGLLLGSIARTEAQAVGLGVLLANALAALGGCWWPIEITPGWMQSLQMLLPTGWTMDALHKLISFEAGAVSALPNTLLLFVAAVIVASVAARRFRYV